MPGPPSPHHTVPVHRVGGRYLLRGEIGRGGMASVHRAIDIVLNREVAIKLPHAHLAADQAFLDRFRREARAAAALDHPNVVAVHDWGEDDTGAFLVLQLINGPSLREVLRHSGRLDPATAAAVLRPGAQGLAAAHAAGLVHRDVKPENLLLGRDGTVRVTDFGLARAAASASSTFGTDVLMGSPHYLAPEAVHGEPLDPRADVYALGVVLFECLTGRPPHQGESPFATAVAHTARAVPPPSQIVPGLDPALDDLVLAATSIDRHNRPDDAALFASELATLVPRHVEVSLGAVAADLLGPPPPPAGNGATRRLPVEDTTTAVSTGTGSDDPAAGRPEATSPGAAVEVMAEGIDDEADDDLEHDDLEHDDDLEHAAVSGGRPRRRWVAGLVLVVALLAASAAAGYLLWDRVLAPVSPIPAVAGMPVDDAVEQLDQAGFGVDVGEDATFDLDVPEGHVLTQDPTGEARQGTVVELVVSAGPRPVEVPDVLREPVDAATETLTGAGLEPEVSGVHHEDVPEGMVVATEPEAGVVVDEASPVTVVVSLGREPIDVPDLRGDAIDDAQATLHELGLDVRVGERRFDDELPAGTVVAQSPEPGDTLFRDDTVEVVVSDGPAPIEVPSVRGEQLDDAVATLEAAGFSVAVELRGGFGAFLNPGRVFDQDPGPGATRHRGDTVTVYAYED